jgi:hypothetical protein
VSSEHPTDAEPSEYVVTFERIGRHGGNGGPAPDPLIRAYGGRRLADDIATYARRFLDSPAFDVVINDDGRGWIFAGVRTAGTFTIATGPRKDTA